MGLPNAGKSTFLAATTAAKPKIADYPFTTLHPGLGVVRAQGREFVLADIPGLIEGAHEGLGLGDRFLGHVERCSVLLHLVDGTGEHAGKDYKTVRHEIEAYGEGLAEKPEIVALSKIDSLDPETRKKQMDRLKRACGQKPMLLSAVSGEGVPEALNALLVIIEAQRKEKTAKRPRRNGSREPQAQRPAKPREIPPHRHQGRLLAAGREVGRPERGLAEGFGGRHREPAQGGADILVVSSGAIAMGARC